MKNKMMRLQTGFVVFLCSCAVAYAASLTSITPTTGSTHGGVLLTILGSGLPTDLSTDPTNPSNKDSLSVTMSNSKGESVPCTIHIDGCTNDRVTCHTGRMNHLDNYKVNVMVNNTLVPTCSDEKKCIFRPNRWLTPTIEDIIDQSNKVGELIKVYGAIFTSCHNSSTACPRTVHNWQAVITRVYGPAACSLLDEAGNVYKLEMDANDEHNTKGHMWFKPKSTYIGFFNASFIVDPYGRSMTDTSKLRVSITSGSPVIYTLQRYTEITAITPQQGSTEGGTEIAISVPHIEDKGSTYKKAVEVYVGCQPCTEKTVVTNQHVTCKTPKLSTTSTACGGNRGLFVEYWTTLADLDTAKTASNPAGMEHFDETKICDLPINQNWTRLTGYFKAPFTGRYCPGILATTEGKLFVDETQYGHSQDGSWSCANTKELVAGNEYAILAVAKPGACLEIRMQFYNTTLTRQMTGQALQERQILRATSTITLEHFTLSFSGGAAKQAAVHEQQTIRWTGNPNRQLCLFGVCTRNVDLTDTTTVATELNKHANLDGTMEVFIVETDNTAPDGTSGILVTFESPRGNIPNFVVLPDTDVTATETRPGKSDNEVFAVEMNGIPSPILKYVSNNNTKMAENLKHSLDGMLGVQCPKMFLESDGVFDVTEGFEGGPTKFPGATTEIPPFCGNYAIKNKDTLFPYQGSKAPSIALTPFLCFAISGLDNDNVELRFEKPGGVRQRTVPFTSLTDGNWKYACINLKTTYEGIWNDEMSNAIKLIRVRFFQEKTPADDFYFDSLMITANNPLTVSDITFMRLGPALPNMFYKFTVDTTTSTLVYDTASSKFNVTWHPNDCGYDFSLLTVSGGAVGGSKSALSSQAISNVRETDDLKMTTERITSASQGLNGTFKLSFNGTKSGAMSITYEEDELKQATETIQGIGVMNVFFSSSATCHNKDIYFEFTTLPGDLPDIELSHVSLMTESHTLEMKSNVNGQLIISPIPGDMISTKTHTKPQITVTVNGIPTKCGLADCGFTYSAENTPTLSGMDTSTGYVGLTRKITGTKFSTTPTDNEVTVAGIQWTVTAATETELTCTVNNGPLGTHPVKVNVKDKGVASGLVEFEYQADLENCTPKESTLAAGRNITCTGYGFAPSSKLLFGDRECVRIVERSSSSMQCLVPEYSDLTVQNDVQVQVSMKTGDTLMSTTVGFTYNKIEAEIQTITLPSGGLGVSGGQTITVSGTDMGTDGLAFLDDVQLEVVSRTNTNIELRTPPLPKGDDQTLRVFYGDLGAITYSESGGARKRRGTSATGTNKMAKFNVQLHSYKMYPTKGSLFGGTPLTIIGKGYGDDEDKVQVKLGNIGCDITSVANEKIICEIDQPGTVHKIDNTGVTGLYGYYFEFSKLVLGIVVGDSVEFCWSFPSFLTEQTFGVYEIVSTSDKTLKPDGISSGSRTRKGCFKWSFNKAGTHVLWTGIIDTDDRESMMTVNVVDRESWKESLSVWVDGQEADYKIDSNVADPVDTSGCVEAADLSDCTLENIAEPDPNKFNFHFTKCRTATLTSVGFDEATIARSATAKTELTFTGSGFSTTNCANQPKVDQCPCVVTESSASAVKCTPATDCSLDVGRFLPLSMSVNQWGNVWQQMVPLEARSIAIVPYISVISPTSGSKNGGTPVTITATGYSDISQVSVQFGIYAAVCSTDTGSLVCESPAGTSTVSVSLKVNEYASVCDACSFEYETNQTPVLTVVSPSSISLSGTLLTVTASNFGTDITKLAVDVAGEECSGINIISQTKFKCTVANVPAGTSTVNCRHEDWGKASSTATVNGVGSASLSPDQGSVHGGTNVSVTGFGFTDDVTVKVGDVDICKSMYVASPNQLYCETIAHAAGAVTWKIAANGYDYPETTFTYDVDKTPKIASVSPQTGHDGTQLTLDVSDFGTDSSDVTVWIGDAKCSNVVYSGTTVTLNAGSEIGGSHAIQAHVAGLGYSDVNVNFEYTVDITSLSPSTGDMLGGQILALHGSGFTSDTTVKICDNLCTFEELVSGNEYHCLTPPHEAGNCNVVATEGSSENTYESPYTYQADYAPKVTAFSPQRGGTGGNTLVTFTGTGFSSSSATVAIDGVDCAVVTDELTADTIKCHTGPHVGTEISEVVVTTNGQRAVWTISPNFYYVDVWSSTASWGGGSLPQEGDMIVIPEGQTMLLDTDTPILSMLLIDGGDFIFDDIDVILNAERILITKNGSLQVGTEKRPFPCSKKATIMMHGNQLSPEQPVYGTKGIGVRNGTLDLHGCPIENTATLLASTAEAGADTITVQHNIDDWQVGDQLAIATTGDRHSQKESEVGIIKSKSGKTITLAQPLEYKHLGETDTLLSYYGKPFEMRAEVILLRRNVLFRGTENTSWNTKIEACPNGFDTGEFVTQTCFQGRFGEEVGSDEFGGHILFHNPIRNSKGANGHMSYIEMTYVGQAFRLGRYPIHFHLNGDMSESYVRGCAIHKSFNRAVNIHGSDNILVEHNVIYNIMGGAYFLEDGAEEGNIFQYNMAIFVRASTALRNDDVTPAAFWATNPNNTYLGNGVAGGTHFGFWYRMHDHPDGPSFDSAKCPKNEALGVFKNNTVHSNGWYGLWIFETYFPCSTECCSGNSMPVPAPFRDLTVWNSHKGAEFVTSSAAQLINFLSVSNEVGAEYKKIEKVKKFNPIEGALINNSVIAGQPRKSSLQIVDNKRKEGFTGPFGDGFSVHNVHFVNFLQSSNSTAINFAKMDGTCIVGCGATELLTNNLTFDNVDYRLRYEWHHQAIIHDLDGSLSGKNVETKILTNSSTINPDCDSSLVGKYPYGIQPMACPGSSRYHRLALNEVKPASHKGKPIIIKNNYGISEAPYYMKGFTHKDGYRLQLPDFETTLLAFQDAESTVNYSMSFQVSTMKKGDIVIIGIYIESLPDQVSLDGGATWNEEAKSLFTASTSGVQHGDWYYHEGVVGTAIVAPDDADAEWDNDFNGELMIVKCFYKDCIAPVPLGQEGCKVERPTDILMWNDANTWENVDGIITATGQGNGNSRIPQAMDNVTIPRGVNVVIKDVNPARMNYLTIFGYLEVDNTTNFSYEIEVYFMVILGGQFSAGWQNYPLMGQLDILLKGDATSPTYFNGNYYGQMLGNKVIGNAGCVGLYGRSKGSSWTTLAATVQPNADSFTVDSTADVTGWNVGDAIVVTTTSFKPEETEKLTIKSISGREIGVTTNFQYRHSVGTDQWDDKSVTFAAAVGLMSRYIVIRGDNDRPDEYHGGRFITGVASWQNGTTSTVLTGSSHVWWTEFRHMGQYGYASEDDPRFALAYANLGTPVANKEKKSSVRHCSFAEPYNSAVGVFSSNEVKVESNVMYATAGHGTVIGHSNNVQLKGNLGANLQCTATYKGRFETYNPFYEAIFKVHDVQSFEMSDNRAVGSERAGFHVPGEACDSNSLYSNNWASSCLHGAMVQPNDDLTSSGISDCVRFSNFTFYMNADHGLYYNNKPSVLVEGCLFAENVLGLFTMMYEPPSLSHVVGNKKAVVNLCTFLGTSSASDCASEPNPDSSYAYYQHSFDHRTGLESTGKFGVMWSIFTSGSNEFPKKPADGIMSYNQINGKMIFKDNTVVNYNGASAGCKPRYLFSTSPKNEDLQHYILTSNVKQFNSQRNNFFFFHRPNVQKVNPSDCVDMTCDALTKAMIRDEDGSLLGASGTVLPFSEFEWDGDRRYGKGDYRIPKEMLADPNTGDKLDVTTGVAKYRGLYREGCVLVTEGLTSYYICTTNYNLYVIESLDNDTESRRLSPVAVLNTPDPLDPEKGYLDLLNGPQDHGWCNGYTCQFRLSTFHAVVAAGVKHAIIYLSSTPPAKMAFYMLGAADDDCVIVKFYHNKPNRLDIYVPDTFVTPKNVDDSNNDYKILREAGVDYRPTCNDVHGANYVNRDEMLLYFVTKGNGIVKVVKKEVVIASFKAITENDYFGEKMIENIALLLGIPLNKIRVVNIVAATSSRRRRDTEHTVTIEIGDPPTDDPENPGSDVSQYAADLMEVCQLGSISDQLDMNAECDEITSHDVVYYPTPPSYLDFVQTLTSQHENVPFKIQPKIRAFDQYDDVVEDLGTAEFPWEITATLHCTGCHVNAQLVGTTTIPAVNGWFNFTDLGISHKGNGYVIEFTITSPSAAVNMNFSVESEAISVAGLPMTASIHSMTVDIISGNTFSITLDLRDETTNQQIPDLRWRDHTKFDVDCDLVVPSRTGNLSGTLSGTFDMDSGLATMDSILYTGYGLFYIACHTISDPAEYMFDSAHKVVVIGTHQVNIISEATENVAVRSKLSFDETLPTVIAKAQFHQAFLEYFIATFPYILFTESEISRGSIVITFSVEGSSSNVSSALSEMCEDLSEGLAVTIGSSTVKLDSYMTVDGEDFYATCGKKDDDDETGLHPAYIALIVILALLLIAVIVFLVYWRCKVQPKKRTHGDYVPRSQFNDARRFQVHSYPDNGRTVFLAGPNQKVNDIFYKQKTTIGINQTESIPPVGTLYDDSPGYLDVRKSPLPPDLEMGARASSSLTPTGR